MASKWLWSVVLFSVILCGNGETNLPPVFTQDMDNLALSESTPVGTRVYSLQGKDPEDYPIKYGLAGTDRFSVVPETGDVMLIKPLDREVVDNIKFLVSIEDVVPGASNNVVQVPVTVIVLDENDNPPVFKNSPYEVEVPEDEITGKIILENILVDDVDTVGDNLEVTCVSNAQWPDACDIFEVVPVHSTSNNYNGNLILKKRLDYNTKQFYQFQLHASDGTLNSTADVSVQVLDVQNSPPSFTVSLSAAVSEDVTVGTTVLTVHARDTDRAMPRDVYYELLTNPHDFFLLDSSTGELKTAKPLDREALLDPNSPLNLTVRASEIVNGQPVISNMTSTLATVTVTVRDVNDEPPRFNRKEYRVEIPESLPVGTPLPNLDMVVTDTDVGINSVFTLRVLEQVGAFIVEPGEATGTTPVTLKLNSSLDYEDPNQRKFILEVIAEELHTTPRLLSKASVTITVLDVNDNSPEFPSPVYSAKVIEDALKGHYVTAITATDRDTKRFGTEGIIYELFGVGSELFSVDKRTGVITVAACSTPGRAPCLDLETKKDYFLHYKATDNDGLGQTTQISLQISLVDANDNPPVFTTALYKASIDEDANKFEPELQVQARDADQTSEIRYSIIEPDNSTFWVDPLSGKIGVMTETNIHVEGDDSITLVVQATDGIHNATCTVEIIIRDVNNHAPIFDSLHYNVSLREDAAIGDEVTTVKATDEDSGVNAQIKYSVQKGALDAFTVDNQTGVVTVSSNLDYDKRNVYRIIILASDLGMPSLTGSTELTVTVINVNDKKPYFTPQVQRAEVSADAEVGTVVHQLSAMDPDVSDIKLLHYGLDTSKPIKAVLEDGQEVTEEGIFSNWFAVDDNGGVVVSSRLVRTRAAVLTLPVLVIDTTANTLQQAQGELIIRIVDVNRHSPVFPQSHYNEKLTENQPIGTVLNTYIATDKESPIAYISIEPPSTYFAIDNKTGIVRSTQRIDYEKVHRIEFRLIAFDSGVPQLSGEATVTVEVININDEVPQFNVSAVYEASIVENAKEGAYVLSVQAFDRDEGKFGELRYNLSGENAHLFHIDPVDGVITVSRGAVLDREANAELSLQAIATDGAHTATHPVHIKILDENDNSPIFTQKVYKSTIAENLPLDPPAAILQVLAEDHDEGDNARVRYQIIHQSVPDTFKVDESTGIIYPLKEVAGDTTYHMTITATDEFGAGSHFDTAKVDIKVLSVNKHKPVFVVPAAEQRMITIPENAAQSDYLVLTVKATDDDQGENGRISYYFKIGNQNVVETSQFIIDPNSGEIRTKNLLDREVSPDYHLVLVAIDNGTPAKYESLHFLKIVLEDSNDNIPHFQKQKYEFHIVENLPAGVIIGSVKAIDKDSGENGRIFYHIVDGNQEKAFTLDRTQGFLRANVSFDREKQSEYSLTLYASNNPVLDRPSDVLNAIDNGTATERSLARVVVRILDLNDNEPEFEHKLYYAGIKHTAKMNEQILSMVAKDDDLNENGTLKYLIAASNLYKFGDQKSSGSIVPSPFNITQEGMVTTASFMSEYVQDRFVLDVIAQEIALPHRRATAQLYVWIIDSSQTIRVIVSQPCARASTAMLAVISRLSDASQTKLVICTSRHYVRHDTLFDDWCEIHLLAVDPSTHQVLTPERVLESIDAKYDELKDLYQSYGVETVIAASAVTRAPESFDPALAALIALLIVLFTGIVTFVVVCSCLKHWVISPPSLQSSKGDSLARRRILEELSTTENPLWLETKLRPYEEQELTMNVFGDQNEQVVSEPPVTDNTYATIQTNRDTISDYTTLAREHAPLEAALGFEGSTFKPPTPTTPEPPPRPVAGLSHS